MKKWLLSLCLCGGLLLAQDKYENLADYKLAQQAYNLGHFHQAVEHFLFVFPKVKSVEGKGKICWHLGKSYQLMHQYIQAEQWYLKAIRSTFFPKETFIALAEVLQAQNRYDDALTHLNTYKEQYGADLALENALRSIQFAKDESKNTTRYQIKAETWLNSIRADFNPRLYQDDRLLLFTSSREAGQNFQFSPITGEPFLNIFYAEKDAKGKWSFPQPFDRRVNSDQNESDAALDPEGNFLYFTRCPKQEGKISPCHIYQSRKNQTEWETPTIVEGLKPAKDINASVLHPFVSADGEHLFYASNAKTEDSKGGFDIWVCKKAEQGKWKDCEVLEGEVNTAKNELYPYLRHNGDLYFSSDGHLGMGGLDIFLAKPRKKNHLHFEKVENLGYPINSGADDFGICFEAESKEITKGYFSSNRIPEERDNLYGFVYQAMRFDLLVSVRYEDTGLPIMNAKVVLEGQGADSAVHVLYTGKNGSVSFLENPENLRYVKENSTYTLTVSKPEDKVLSQHQIFSTKGRTKSDNFFLNFVVKVDRQKPLAFPEVRYDLDQWTLQVNKTVNSKDSLDYLFDLLLDNPSIAIQIQAHTDSRGADDYNLKLSQKRAEACVDYLVNEKGIDKNRLSSEGFGKNQLRYDDAFIAQQPEEEQENYHQKNRRTEFIITSWDYKKHSPIQP